MQGDDLDRGYLRAAALYLSHRHLGIVATALHAVQWVVAGSERSRLTNTSATASTPADTGCCQQIPVWRENRMRAELELLVNCQLRLGPTSMNTTYPFTYLELTSTHPIAIIALMSSLVTVLLTLYHIFARPQPPVCLSRSC